VTPPSQDFGLRRPFWRRSLLGKVCDAPAAIGARAAGAEQPIRLDAPFPLEVTGPGGRARCYDLDLRPAHPARFYVFYAPGTTF
jgi:hypothetical protein